MRLAKIKKGRIWLNPKLKGDKRRRVLRHMQVFKNLRKEGVSRSKAIGEARKAEHRGMTKRQVWRYEGELGALARYFETHSEYSFEYLGSNYNDEILKSYSSMQLTRISKWLAHFGLVQHHAEHVAHTNPHDENKKVLMHTVKPTQKGFQVIEQGEIFDVGQSHSGSHKVGVGKAYPSFVKCHKWLGDAYLSVKVAQWRQSKWWGEFNRFYYDNVDRTADEMQRLLSRWLSEKLATIPARHTRLIKAAAPLEVALSKSMVEFCR